jgi:hypothetical protein
MGDQPVARPLLNTNNSTSTQTSMPAAGSETTTPLMERAKTAEVSNLAAILIVSFKSRNITHFVGLYAEITDSI